MAEENKTTEEEEAVEMLPKIEVKSDGMDEECESSKKHDKCIRWGVSIVVSVTFFCLGVSDTVIGPTLLDLKEVYDTELSKITFLVILRSIGSMCGIFTTGIILDRFARHRCLILFSYIFFVGLATLLTPLAGNLYFLMVVSFIYGFNGGGLDAGSNVLILDAWRGLDSGPFLHSIHFSFGVGAFVGPVVAQPFLIEHVQPESLILNETNYNLELNNSTNFNIQDLGVKALFPIIGCFTMLTSLGHIYFYVKNPKVLRGIEAKDTKTVGSNEATGHPKSEPTFLIWCFVIIISVMFMLYVGQEVTYGLFIASFSVKSKLQLTKSEGAFITAIFWGSFAAMRFVAIFAAIKLKPHFILVTSFAICLIGSIPLAVWAETDEDLLKVCSSFLGFGMASIFATGYLWAEQYLVVNNKISAAFVISGSLGAKLFPLLLGQTLEIMPMLIMYLQIGITIICIILFICSYFVGRKILQHRAALSSEQT